MASLPHCSHGIYLWKLIKVSRVSEISLQLTAYNFLDAKVAVLEDEEAYTSCIKLQALNEVREKLAKPYARTPHVALRVPTDGVHVTTLIFRTPSPGLLALLLS